MNKTNDKRNPYEAPEAEELELVQQWCVLEYQIDHAPQDEFGEL